MPLSYPVSRRRFVAVTARAVVGVVAGPALLGADGARAEPLPTGLFTLGVASGDPIPDGIVLWTRLAPAPLAGGGMPDRPVPVGWELADDELFHRVRRRGVALAVPCLGHSVHVEVRGLAPDREYFYRFRVGGEASPVGRTRTAPAPGSGLQRLRLAFASCQDFQAGAYTAYTHLIQEDIAFVAFLGDYIYESAPDPLSGPRMHEGTGEPRTLPDYRNRHAQYKTDPHLQAVHATFPWIVTLDDHELHSNWADEIGHDRQPPEAFRARRIAAFQAYYEHMPLRRTSLPRGLEMRLYRRLRFGRLASVHVLDTRQYRSDQPTTLAEANDPNRTMTGARQERWLTDGLRHSGTRWNLLANQVMWASNDRLAGPAQEFDLDNWDGYRVQRRRLLEFLGRGGTSNPVVLTGDRHATWVCDLRPEFDHPATPAVAAEITGPSVTSEGDPDRAAFHARYDPIMAESPHWKYIDARRGYVLCDVTPDRLTASLRVVDTVRAPTANITTAATFQVTAGRGGIEVVRRDGP